MLPTVALYPQVQPHHHLDHYRASDALSLPYDWTNSAFPSSFTTTIPHDGLVKPPPYHSVPRPQFQFPHPVQRLDAHASVDPKPAPKNSAEHALRRKTPNGTLAAGYDGSPADTTVQPPATKHILVSPLESTQSFQPSAALQLDNYLQPSVNQSSAVFSQTSNNNRNNSHHNNTNTPATTTATATATTTTTTTTPLFPGDAISDSNGTGWVCSPNTFPPGFDSSLPLPPQQPQQRFFLPNNPDIPTVLPAALQPCFGPTASGGSGPFGPYWPDGAYVPYRPAALRDSHSDSLSTYPGPPFYNMGQSSFGRPSLSQTANLDPAYLWNQVPTGLTDNNNNQDHTWRSNLGNFAAHHPTQRSLLEASQKQHTLPYQTRQSKPPSTGYAPQPLGNDINAWSGNLFGSGFPPAAVPSRTGSAEFKEKALSWAHGVYVDLLAAIHQARRNSIASGAADGQNLRLLKPTIYPKPPRQPGLDFSSQNNASETPRRNSYISSQYDQQTPKASNGVAGVGRHSFPVQSSPGFLINRHRERPILSQYQQHRAPDAPMTGVGKFPGSTPSMPSHYVKPVSESSSVANAVSALEMLSHLCMESNWEWIDGMLLGGCLAYGLGDYHKAMRWYSRIIVRDET